MTLVALILGAAATASGATAEGTVGGRRTDVTLLPAALQGVMSATFGADDPAYRVAAEGRQYRADNARHGFAATMGAEGLAIHKGEGEWRLWLTGWGRGEGVQGAGVGAIAASANRLEVQRSGVTEWWVNGPLGLEQGWTLAAPPQGNRRGPLTLVLAQSGSLRAGAGAGERELAIADRAGRTVLRYAGLAAYDAIGRELPASFEVLGGDVRVRVDDAGAAYPVRIDPWLQTAELTASDGAADDNLGGSVAVSADGSTVVAGAYLHQVGSNVAQGAAYVFVKPSTGWASTSTYAAELTASDGAASDFLGYDVSVDGDGSTVVAGTFAHKVGSNVRQGAVYIFVRPSTGWANATQTAELTASDGAANDGLGDWVALNADGSTVAATTTKAVGTHQEQGAVYVFVKPSTGWASTSTYAAELTASDGAAFDLLGQSLGLSGDGSTVVAGAFAHKAGNNAVQGAVYVFVKPGSANGWADWITTTNHETAELTASDGAADDALGTGVAVSGDGSTVVAGASGRNNHRGAEYVFVKPSSGWASATQTAELTASDGATNDGLGLAAALSADASTVVAWAPGKTVGGAASAGAVYVFVRPSGGWAGWSTTTNHEAAQIASPDGAPLYTYGHLVSVSGDGSTVAAGAYLKTVGSNSQQGAVYVFQLPAAGLAFTQQPASPTTAGATLGSASGVTVQLRDASGTIPISQGGVSVSIALTSGTGPLHGVLSATTDTNGTATFGDLSINVASSGNRLTASSTGLASAISSSFNITAAAAANIAATSGTSQSATVGNAFQQPLEVTVTDAFGNLVSGVNVTFTAPASGASATLSNGGHATTDADGLASVTATANSTAGGPYQVMAQVTGVTSQATFSLTNDPHATIPVLSGVGLGALALLVLACGALALTRWRLGG